MKLILPMLIVCALLSACAPFESRFLRVPMRTWTPPERAEVLDIPGDDSAIIKAWIFRPSNSSNAERLPALIIAHGRSDVMGDYRVFGPEVADASGHAVVLFDYRGFGASSELDSPTRQSMIEDTRSLIDSISQREDLDRDRFILWGISLGAYPTAANFIDDDRINALVLWGAPANIHDVIRDGHDELNPMTQLVARVLIPRHRAPEDELEHAGTRPVLIAHAQHDEIVHVRHAYALHEAAPNSMLLIDETGTHATISSETLNAIIEWTRSQTP